MKLADRKKKSKKTKNKSKLNKPVSKQKVLIVARELKFARLLAGNEKKTRDKVLKTLCKWLKNCFEKGYEFKDDDFIRVWKGIFYAVWMSDKPLIQEELCENVSSILDQFPVEKIKEAMMMVKAGFKVLATEWYGIDQHRIDKFLMLVRRYLRGALRCLRRCDWSAESCQLFADSIGQDDGIFAPKTPLYARNAISMTMHIADCFVEEISKVSEGVIPPESLTKILTPLANYCAFGDNPRVCISARRVFTQLARQSDEGREMAERTAAWERMGCPEGGPEALEPASDDDEDANEDHSGGESDGDADRPLDPRAGRVNVVLAPIPTPASQLVDLFKCLLLSASGSAHKRVKNCMQTFQRLTKGAAPFTNRVLDSAVTEEMPLDPVKSAKELSEEQERVTKDETRELLKTLSRRQRKRLLAKARAGQSIVEELQRLNKNKENVSSTTTNGDWSVEEKQEDEKAPQKNKTKKRKVLEDTSKKPKDDDDSPKKIKLVVKSDTSPKKQSDKKKVEKLRKNKEVLTTTKAKDNSPKVIETSPKEKVNSQKVDIKNSKTKINVQNDRTQKKLKGVTKPEKVKITVKSKDATKTTADKMSLITPKKVKFVLKNNSMQKPVDYYKSVKQSPNIPYDGSKKPSKTNLKPSTPSPINPFLKKKLKLKF